jgi:hypothetical protein
MSDDRFQHCLLCKRANTPWKGGVVVCDVCGQYNIQKMMILANDLSMDDRLRLSAIVRRHFDLTGEPETITPNNWRMLASQAPAKNDVPSKVRYLLGYVAHKSSFPGEAVALMGLIDYPVCFAANEGEFSFYLQHAVDARFIKENRSQVHTQRNVFLTPEGWQETMRIAALDSPYAFVAMAFSTEGDRGTLLTQAFEEAIRPAIEDDAGYEKAKRIDKEEFLGDIVFEIIARIKECRFLVADVTEHRNGVYFEAGYAMGMGLPVIWTCHEDDIETAHFDTRNLNHIVWNDIDGLRKSLANRILATIGRGPKAIVGYALA